MLKIWANKGDRERVTWDPSLKDSVYLRRLPFKDIRSNTAATIRISFRWQEKSQETLGLSFLFHLEPRTWPPRGR